MMVKWGVGLRDVKVQSCEDEIEYLYYVRVRVDRMDLLGLYNPKYPTSIAYALCTIESPDLQLADAAKSAISSPSAVGGSLWSYVSRKQYIHADLAMGMLRNNFKPSSDNPRREGRCSLPCTEPIYLRLVMAHHVAKYTEISIAPFYRLMLQDNSVPYSQ